MGCGQSVSQCDHSLVVAIHSEVAAAAAAAVAEAIVIDNGGGGGCSADNDSGGGSSETDAEMWPPVMPRACLRCACGRGVLKTRGEPTRYGNSTAGARKQGGLCG